MLNWPNRARSVLLSQDDYQRQGSGYRNASPARACCFRWVHMFMLAVTLPGWDCVRMHACTVVLATDSVWQMKCMVEPRVTDVSVFFVFLGLFFVERQWMRFWMQVCEGASKMEMLAQGLLLTPLAPQGSRPSPPEPLAPSNANTVG